MIWLEILRTSGIERREITVIEGAWVARCGCPGCKCSPFIVGGHSVEKTITGLTKSCGQCLSCADPVGYIFAEPDTIFGAEEDRAVLTFGRARVYGGGIRP